MKTKYTILCLSLGIVMAAIWSIVFVNVLNSLAGIGIGIGFGVAFASIFSVIFSSSNKK